ncbi:M23 family peptidase [Helicobacter didelphidarum]|uniref:M23 family peptidase n=1 Tax=Helicobacter didelphidarum TaxID=2040648 RepID=A0A3D8IN80_9HELI|nr:peptidoglycan DD-metalloendopeptidase family protein [Helicobacter didelphidarum]RDU66709.1 M23 family peptidase [Helicobacter didelphidarum]
MKDIQKIKQTLTITIVDENGSRQFTMAKVMQRVIAYGFLFLFCSIIAGYFAMSIFIEKLDQITVTKQETYKQFQSMHEQNVFLQDDIQSKSEELQVMRDKINDLEKMMSLYAFNRENNKLQEIDLQNLATTQKATILQIIPNGNPVNLFEMKQKTSGISKELYVLVNTGNYPTQNVANMGYNYYTGKSEPVFATADGIVESTRENNQRYGYGNLVRLSHVLGFSTAYTNLTAVNVKKGDFVSRGDIIGYTTPSPGKSHTSLYYEVRFLSESLDTLSFIDWDKHNFKSIFDPKKNTNIDIKSLMWALNDIVKLNDISTHFAYNGVENLISNSNTNNTLSKQAFNATTTNQLTTHDISINDKIVQKTIVNFQK